MGAWSVSITGNDLAQDMRPESSIAFSRHDPEAAVALLDAYMHRSAGATTTTTATGWTTDIPWQTSCGRKACSTTHSAVRSSQ